MKKMLFTLIAMLTIAVSASAMSYEQARNEALFLTDKMAYELNLTDAQYEAAYEINLDYLMGVTGRHDVFGVYWERRNLDLSYILLSWQWNAFCAATYFYRPLYWDAGYWHFGIYAHYPRRDYFFFGRPHFYVSYRGGHSWRMNGGHSYYEHHRDHYRTSGGEHGNHSGMRDGWDRGDYRGQASSSTRVTGGERGNRTGNTGYGNDNRSGRDDRSSASRTQQGSYNRGTQSRSGSDDGTYNVGSRSRSIGTSTERSGSFGGSRSTTGTESRRSTSTTTESTRSTGSFGGSRSSYTPSRSTGSSYSPSRSTGSSYSPSRSTSSSYSPSHSSSSMSRSSSSSSMSRSSSSSMGSSRSSGSFGGGSRSTGGSRSGGSFGGGSRGRR